MSSLVILGSGFLIFLYLIFIILVFLGGKSNTNAPAKTDIAPVSATPVPTAIKDGPGDAYNKSMVPIIKKELSNTRQSYNATLLLNELPYTTNSFSLAYDYKNGSFILALLSTDKTRAMEDFRAFLNKKGVLEKDMGEVVVK